MSGTYLFAERLQYPVGSGFFHAGRVTSVERNQLNPFTYIYDCGTVGARVRVGHPPVDLPGCVDHLRGSTGWNSGRVDVLYISHFHEDHVSGIPLILSRFRPRQIVIPYTDIVDRVAAAVSHRLAGTVSGFYFELIINPEAALFSAFGEADDDLPLPQIFVVSPHDGPSDSDPEELSDRDVFPATGWQGPNGPVAPGSPGAITAVDDRGHIRVASGTRAYWLLKPWVDPMIDKQKNQLRKAVSDDFKVPYTQVDSWLTNPVNVRAVIDRLDVVGSALRKVKHRFNVTSLSLFSGPIGSFSSLKLVTGGYDLPEVGQVPVGWLATGDAELTAVGRRERFLDHFAPQHNAVATLALPHHGSRGNFHPDLLTKFRPSLCVVGSGGKYEHPHKEVSDAVLKHTGNEVVVADTGVFPALREFVWAFL